MVFSPRVPVRTRADLLTTRGAPRRPDAPALGAEAPAAELARPGPAACVDTVERGTRHAGQGGGDQDARAQAPGDAGEGAEIHKRDDPARSARAIAPERRRCAARPLTLTATG